MSVFERNKRFSELDQKRVGLVAIIALVLALAALLNIGKIVGTFADTTYTAVLADAAGLTAGDPVRVSGVDVGAVRSVDIEDNHILVEFATSRALGDETRVEIKSDTLLGAKFLDLQSRGTGSLEAGAQIPIDRTESNYELPQALSDLATTSGAIDTEQLARSLDTLSAAFANTPAVVSDVLDGTKRLARVVASRDDELGQLLRNAESVTGVLVERNTDLIGIIADSNTLMAALQERRKEIGRLFTSVSTISTQLSGVVDDNEDQLGPVLAQLRRSLAVINDNIDDLDEAISGFGGFSRSLLEAVGGGPFFYGYIAGIAPANMQPVLDSLLTDLLPHPEEGGTP